MRTVTSSDGVRLAVHELATRGERGDGPVLVVHANGFHGRVFGPLAAYLTCAPAAVAPDLRGHGDSPLPDPADAERLAWHHFADDVLAVVDAFEWDRPLAIGHSLGGAALVLAEHRRPGTFRSLYLYEPVVMPPVDPAALLAAGLPTGANPMADAALRRRERFGSHEEAIENFASKPPLSSLAPEALDAYVRFGFAEQPDGTVALRCGRETEAAVYRTGSANGAWERLGDIGCPVTVAAGGLSERGGMGPGAVAAQVAERLPHGRLERFEQLGHFGPLEAPELLAAAIDRAFTAG